MVMIISDGKIDDSSDVLWAWKWCLLFSSCTLHNRSQIVIVRSKGSTNVRNSELRNQKCRKFWKIMDINGG